MVARIAPALSIVVPFYNSVGKCEALLRTLDDLGPDDGIELILVDDGSTDGTANVLAAFAERAAIDVLILSRDNSGPGGARNHGLARASGRFVWFVDSDDDLDLTVVRNALRSGEEWEDVDVIVWGFEHPTIRSLLAPGVHSSVDAPAPPDIFDPIVVNWYARSFLRRTGLSFPEYCIFEATPIEAFVLPLLVSRYVKYDEVAYKCRLAHASVTRRTDRSPGRFYDRLDTTSLGMAFVESAELNAAGKKAFDQAFVRLFLWYSVPISIMPGRSWVRAARVMRRYVEEARRFAIHQDPFDEFPGRMRSRLVMRLLWRLSSVLPSQMRYFERLRQREWGRPLVWNPPTGRRIAKPHPRVATAPGKTREGPGRS